MRNREKLKHIIHMRTALNYSELSHCERAKVGALLVRDNRPISVGYNGLSNNSECDCCEDENGVTRPEVIHAEMNAIIFAASHGIAVKDSVLYVTLAPCKLCSQFIIQSGIKQVYYLNDYRNNGIRELLTSGVSVTKLYIEESECEID